MKKLGTFILALAMMFLLVGCLETETPNPKYEEGNVQFRLATTNDTVNLNQGRISLAVVNQGGLFTPINKENEAGRFLIGDRPEIYFEYSRPEEFSFVEAQVVDSADPDKTFKIQGGLTNLDGYSIITGHNRQNDMDYFRAIITLPHIKDIGEQRYALVQIKITIEGQEVVENIEPEEEKGFEVMFTVVVEDLFLPIENKLDEYLITELIGQNRPLIIKDEVKNIHVADFTTLGDFLDLNYSFNYTVGVDEKHKDYITALDNKLYIDVIGNLEITLTITLNIKGQERIITKEVLYTLGGYNILEADFNLRLEPKALKGINISRFTKNEYTFYLTSKIGEINIENLYITANNKDLELNFIVLDFTPEWIQKLNVDVGFGDKLTVNIYNGLGDLIHTYKDFK